jgi:hypothetical protein
MMLYKQIGLDLVREASRVSAASGMQYPITRWINKHGSSCAVQQAQIIDNGIVSLILRRYASLLNGLRTEPRDRLVNEREIAKKKCKWVAYSADDWQIQELANER